MKHRKVIVAGIAILLLAAGGYAAAQTESGESGDALENRTISVRATADASAPPDIALVRVAVVATAPDAPDAQRQAAANASQLRDALESIGIGDEQIRTTYYHLDTVTRERGNGREMTGYRAAHGFEIEAPVERAGGVVDAAVTNGASRIDGVEFTLTDETRRELRAIALDRAMNEARADAEVIAVASDVTIGGVQSASTADVSYVTAAARLGAGQDDTVIEPGPVTASATVSVTYRIE